MYCLAIYQMKNGATTYLQLTLKQSLVTPNTLRVKIEPSQLDSPHFDRNIER